MADALLSVGSSSLAALLSGANADSAASTATCGTDPFAALLATATGSKNIAGPAKAGSADTLAALLASAAPVAASVAPMTSVAPIANMAPVTNAMPVETVTTDAAPVASSSPAMDPVSDAVDPDLLPTGLPDFPTAARPAPTISKPVAPAPAPAKIVLAAAPVPAAPALLANETAPVEAEATKISAKDKSDDRDDVPSRKADSDDPLGDAIASGATAVLAFAPTIVAPIQPDAVVQTPARVPVRADTAIAATPIKLPANIPAPNLARAQAAVARTNDSTAQAGALIDAGSAQADADARQQPAPAADAKPAATQLSPEVAKAVIAALKQNDAAPLTTVPADPAVSPDAAPPATAAKPQIEQQPSQMTVKPAQQQSVPAPAQATVRRRGDDTPAPRRAGDARRRIDPMPTDVASAGTTQQAGETPRTGFALGASAPAKGDAIVEHTLTIAQDGAWLDRLAKDIAGAGSGNDLHFKLNPQNLGALSVAISQKDDGASIRLTADNQATRDILVDAQPKLIAEARAQGLKVSDTQVDVRQDDKQSQNQSPNQDSQRWAQNQNGQNGQQAQTGQNGQNRQSSPEHKPFVSNLGRKANEDSESLDRDSDALYA